MATEALESVVEQVVERVVHYANMRPEEAKIEYISRTGSSSAVVCVSGELIVKVSNYGDMKRMMEAMKQAQPSSPQPYEHGTLEDYQYLAMSRVPGTSLKWLWNSMSRQEQQRISDQVQEQLERLPSRQSMELEDILVDEQTLEIAGMLGWGRHPEDVGMDGLKQSSPDIFMLKECPSCNELCPVPSDKCPECQYLFPEESSNRLIPDKLY